MTSQLRGRFKGNVNLDAHSYSSSLNIDRELILYDLQAGIAHVTMLAKCKIITSVDKKKLVAGLRKLIMKAKNNTFKFDDTFEDIHMLIEHELTKICGTTGKKLHTARSRNDQTVTATRMWLRNSISEIISELKLYSSLLISLAQQEYATVMPGMTHLQYAQPITLGHLYLAWSQMLFRDLERLTETARRVNVLPLGSGALAGVGFKIDRNYTAKLLDFDKISENSIDAVSDRDFAIEAVAQASIGMMHLSRMAEDIILYSSTPLQFFIISDGFSTGSSMMPQKRNPDIAELIRGKSGIVFGNWTALISMMKAQSLSYNRDNQCDKESLFSAMNVWFSSINMCRRMMKEIKVNKKNMRQACENGYLTATEIADYLTAKGETFRSAYNISARIVRYAEEHGYSLHEIKLSTYQTYSTLFTEDIYKRVSIDGAIHARSSYGGTSPKMVKQAITRAKKTLQKYS